MGGDACYRLYGGSDNSVSVCAAKSQIWRWAANSYATLHYWRKKKKNGNTCEAKLTLIRDRFEHAHTHTSVHSLAYSDGGRDAGGERMLPFGFDVTSCAISDI